MKKNIIAFVIAASYLGITSIFNLSFAAEDMRSLKHPIIGYWESKIVGDNCSETYWFREDGTGVLTSAGEQLEVNYVVDEQPNTLGFFKIKHQVVNNNGKVDCTGNITDIDTAQDSYLLFQPDGRSFIACENNEESMNTCFGPMVLKNNASKNFAQ